MRLKCGDAQYFDRVRRHDRSEGLDDLRVAPAPTAGDAACIGPIVIARDKGRVRTG